MQNTELESYLTTSATSIISDILKASLTYPKASLFMLKFKNYSNTAAKLRSSYETKGYHIPAFLMASITNACNLHCKGCFARANHTCEDESFGNILSSAEWNDIFIQAKNLGISFFILLGGEPLLRKDVITAAGNIPQMLFPIFTNATLLDEAYYTLFEKKRNLIPILSVEGNQQTTDKRRGDGIYMLLEKTMQQLHQKRILFGVSITVTSKNKAEVTATAFLQTLMDFGCKSIIYVEYNPISAEDTFLAIDEQMRTEFTSSVQKQKQLFDHTLFLSFPEDEKSFGGCLAAGRGFFHINANGGAEPCPFSPYSDTNVKDTSLLEALNSPLFTNLAQSGILEDEHIGGCSLYAREDTVKLLLNKQSKK